MLSAHRKATKGFGVAVAMAASVYAMPSVSAAAIKGMPAECARLTDKEAQLRCGSDYYQRQSINTKSREANAKSREAIAKKQSREAHKTIDDANSSNALAEAAEQCFDYLKKGIGKSELSRDDILKSAGGRITPQNACQVAAKFGYGRRASITTPQTN